MSDGQTKTMSGVLGNLPPWPRKPANNSVIAAEQAYRKRSGLPLLSEEDMAALRAGEPMPWERGDGVPAPAAAQSPAASAPAAPPTSSPAAAPAAASAASGPGMTETVKSLLASYPKWSKSAVAAEQARRKRTGQTLLTEAEMAALAGEAPAAAPATTATTAAAPAARPAAPAAPAVVASAASAAARSGEATRYVGTPAVGTSKAAAAGGLASAGPRNTEVDQARRRLVWSAVAAFLGAWFIAFFRFFLPRTLFEPTTVFKIGTSSDYGLGIDEKWLKKYRIWVDRTPERLFVIYARCTHLGCTPDWKPAENKFKCPYHGSGYDNEAINFEGPAPRPMDRAHVELAPDEQILVDVAKLYQWPKGQPSQFNDDGAFLRS